MLVVEPKIRDDDILMIIIMIFKSIASIAFLHLKLVIFFLCTDILSRRALGDVSIQLIRRRVVRETVLDGLSV